MRVYKVLLLAISALLSGGVNAATVCVSSCSAPIGGGGHIAIIGGVRAETGGGGSAPPATGGNLQVLSSVIIDGDLFLDYSIFSSNEDLRMDGHFSVIAQNLMIYAFNDTPYFPVAYETFVSGGSTLLERVGDWVLFSTKPLVGGIFEATGNIYIGNYSELAPVPLPASAWFFISGLLVLYRLSIKGKLTARPMSVA